MVFSNTNAIHSDLGDLGKRERSAACGRLMQVQRSFREGLGSIIGNNSGSSAC